MPDSLAPTTPTTPTPPTDEPVAPVTPPTPSTDPVMSDPQAMVNDALAPVSDTPSPATPAMNNTPPLPEPPKPEPIEVPPVPSASSDTPEPDMTAPKADEVVVTPPPTVSDVPMGDDTPLAFAGSPATTQAEPTVVPPAPAMSAPAPKKGKGSKIMMVLAGFVAFLGLLGGVGYYYYSQYGTIEPAKIANVSTKNKDQCQGCSCTTPNCGGSWLRWVDGQCKANGGSCNNANPNKTDAPPPPPPAGVSPAENCQKTGGFWCENVVDASGKSHSFCGSNSKACYQVAIEKGITMNIGQLRCIQKGTTWVLDRDFYNNNTGDGAQTAQQVIDAYNAIAGTTGVDPCSKTYTPKAGTEKYVCKLGVKGDGDVVYTGGACTAANGKVFKGNEKGCFCGTVQVDTPHGHQSYSSTCGCNEETPPPSAPPSTSPSPSPSAPVMACIGITRNPATGAIGIGDTVTVTCNGSVTPPTAGTLSYKFRYSINNGAFTALTNKTATTAELTIAACGSYKVQCQACATLNGVLTCNPVWTGATQ